MNQAVTLSFVDAAGGALASLGASIARARGRLAVALFFAPAPPPALDAEIAQVLGEIRVMEVVAAGPALTERLPEGAVVLGLEPIAGRAPDVRADIYRGPPETAFGPATLERLAALRISRDRITRWLDAPERT